VLHKTEEEYCAVLRFIAQSRTSTNANTPVTDCKDVDELGKKLEDLNLGKGNVTVHYMYAATAVSVTRGSYKGQFLRGSS
jgi:hypothetical protein